MATYSPLALANTFIARHGRENGVEHLKLQKLAYYAHGWWIAFKGLPFLNERPQVWRYGPVFQSLYFVLKAFGSKPIREPQRSIPFEEPKIIDNEELVSFIDWIWERYAPYSAINLSDQTHEIGTPWRILAEKHGFKVPNDLEIPDNLLRDFFQKEAAILKPHDGT